MTTEEKIEVMKGYMEGKKIQTREIGGKEWTNWVLPIAPPWDWSDRDYRIKPESTYRPYKDTEEMIEDFKKRFNAKVPPYAMPIIWVKNTTNRRTFVSEFGIHEVTFFDVVWDMEYLFNSFTYLDGSPCGIKETE